jgi:drug/metabolite transporter (DMT)-like permease
MQHKEHHGFLYGTLAALCNALTVVFVKLASEAPTFTLLFFRFFISLLLLLPFIHQVKLTLAKIPNHLFRALSGFLSIVFYYYAIERIYIANAITLANTAPLFTPFVALIWLKLLVSKWRFMAAVIGFIGVIFILNPTHFTFELASFAALATGFLSSISFINIRQLSKTESTETILFSYFAIAAFACFFPMIFTWKPIPNPITWLYIALMGLFAYLMQYFITKAFTHAPVSKAGLTAYFAIVFGGAAAWWIWGEIPTTWAVIGTLLTIAGGALALFDKTPPKSLST